MRKILPIMVLGSLLSVSSPFVLAQDPSYGVTMPGSEDASGSGLSPIGIGNPYVPQTWYQQPRDFNSFTPMPTRYVSPNEPAHPEDYAQ